MPVPIVLAVHEAFNLAFAIAKIAREAREMKHEDFKKIKEQMAEEFSEEGFPTWEQL